MTEEREESAAQWRAVRPGWDKRGQDGGRYDLGGSEVVQKVGQKRSGWMQVRGGGVLGGSEVGQKRSGWMQVRGGGVKEILPCRARFRVGWVGMGWGHGSDQLICRPSFLSHQSRR